MLVLRRSAVFPAFIWILSIVLTAAAFAQASTPQSISFVPVSDQVFGVAPFQVIALASSNLPVTLAVSGPASLNGRLLTITGGGADHHYSRPGRKFGLCADECAVLFCS